ncbi:MAG: carbonic anhydrase [Solirubrobacteraceae bacterium]
MTVAITADELIQRNARFAAAGAFAGLPFPSNQTLRVLGCVDSRVDPSHVLGLDLGEAIVMRNIGGRVTPAVLRSWRLLAKLGQQEGGGQPGGGASHLGVLHHTDCGIKRLADDPEMLAEFFEIRSATSTPKPSATRTPRSGSTSTSSGAPFRPGCSCRVWSMTPTPDS